MSDVIPLHQAKNTLSQLVQRAAAGETVLIGPNGRAVAKLTSVDAPGPAPRRLGFMKGKVEIPSDFDDPLPDNILADFEGKP